MSIKELKYNYKKPLKKAEDSKEAVSYLSRVAKLKSKIYSKTKINCIRCNGVGYLRTSLDAARTCLYCCGKGFLVEEIQRF